MALMLLAGTGQVSAQFNNILGLTVSPANPTTNDTITIYADLSFPSSGCDLDQATIYQNGNDFMATSHHCVGMALAICNIQDTFKINPLSAGTYNFLLTLTSGSGPMPCTPGIVPDDADTLTFEVVQFNGIPSNELENHINLYPNPASDQFRIEFSNALTAEKQKTVQLFSNDGRLIKTYFPQEGQQFIEVDENLSNGLYFVQIALSNENRSTKKLMINK